MDTVPRREIGLAVISQLRPNSTTLASFKGVDCAHSVTEFRDRFAPRERRFPSFPNETNLYSKIPFNLASVAYNAVEEGHPNAMRELEQVSDMFTFPFNHHINPTTDSVFGYAQDFGFFLASVYDLKQDPTPAILDSVDKVIKAIESQTTWRKGSVAQVAKVESYLQIFHTWYDFYHTTETGTTGKPAESHISSASLSEGMSPETALAQLAQALENRTAHLKDESQNLAALQKTQTADLSTIQTEIGTLEQALAAQKSAAAAKQVELRTTASAIHANEAAQANLPNLQARIKNLREQYTRESASHAARKAELVKSLGGEQAVALLGGRTQMMELLLNDSLISVLGDGNHAPTVNILLAEIRGENGSALIDAFLKVPGLETLDRKAVESVFKVMATLFGDPGVWIDPATAEDMRGIVQMQLTRLRNLVKPDALRAQRARIEEVNKPPALHPEFEQLAEELNATITVGTPPTVVEAAVASPAASTREGAAVTEKIDVEALRQRAIQAMAKLLPQANGYVAGMINTCFNQDFAVELGIPNLREGSFDPSRYPILPETALELLSGKKIEISQFQKFVMDNHAMMNANDFGIIRTKSIFQDWLHKYGLLLTDIKAEVNAAKYLQIPGFNDYYRVARGLSFMMGGNVNGLPYYTETLQLFSSMLACQYAERAAIETNPIQRANYIQYSKYWQSVDERIENGAFRGQ